jgi:hypothetical protein
VPAVTLNPSDSIDLAKLLASISFWNDFVFLEEGARAEQGRHSLALSNVTYQQKAELAVLVLRAIQPRPWEIQEIAQVYNGKLRT